MLRRLPYHFQIPLGLVLAVTATAVLVSVTAAQISARSARLEIIMTLRRAMELLSAQSRPLLVTDDTWRTFALLRNTAALLPGANKGSARAAIVDMTGRVVAASDPVRLPTGNPAPGLGATGSPLAGASDSKTPIQFERQDGSVNLIEAIQSEDGKTLGYVYVEVDASAFAPDWAALAKPALAGALLAIVWLVPAGWWLGHRMARPVRVVADCIARIGHASPELLQREIPDTADPELARISGAVRRLLAEMSVREEAEERALAAERLAAVGRIAAAVAHEINNPLAGLLTATQTLRLHGGVDAVRLRTVGLIDRGLQQIQVTAAALLPRTRIEDRPLEVSDLDDVFALTQPAAIRQRVRVVAKRNIHAPPLAPSSAIRQVMINLLLNAIKAAGADGQVQAVLTCDARTLRFQVQNTGAPLTQTELDQRLAAEGGSDPRGFGLWICREIAVRYGGGFALSEAGDFATALDFWIPNRPSHESHDHVAEETFAD